MLLASQKIQKPLNPNLEKLQNVNRCSVHLTRTRSLTFNLMDHLYPDLEPSV